MYRFALLCSCLLMSLSNNTSAAPPEPVEYILRLSYEDAIPRSELKQPFAEHIKQRSKTDQSNRWISGVTTASLTLYLPDGKPTGAAVICPGGGYGGLAFDKEGTFIAEWLRERGMAAGVLKYAVSTGNAPLGELPLKQVQLATRLMKNEVPCKVGIIGFSAGGHLAATAANNVSLSEIYDGSPHLMSYDTDLAFHALIYPVVSMQSGITHGGSRKRLLGETPTKEAVDWMSNELRVSDKTPPAFLVHTADDRSVPVANSLRYFEACQQAKVDVEMHIYPTGGHGYGMWNESGTVANWPAAFESWLTKLGMIAAE